MAQHFEPNKTYRVNGAGDLFFDASVQALINREVTFIRFTKGGLAYVCFEGKMFSIPRSNLEEPNAIRQVPGVRSLEGWTVRETRDLPAQYGRFDAAAVAAALSQTVK